MKRIYYIILAFSILGVKSLFGQENPVGNISSLPYFLNPSFYAMNDLGKVGFVYQSEMQNIGSQEERRLVFGSYNFQEGGFTLGLDIDSKTFKSTGFNETRVSGHYIYNLNIDSDWVVNPSLSLSFVSRQFQPGNVFLEDQINILTGDISLTSGDPLLSLIKNRQYISIGAAAVVHNSYNQAFGISIKNINNPNQSIVDGQTDKLKFLTSLQHTVVFDINRYKQSPILPNFTYIRLFNSVAKYGPRIRIDAQQRLDLNDFYLSLSQQINKLAQTDLHKFGFGVGLYVGSIEYGFNYNFNSASNPLAVPFKTLEFFVSFDLSPIAGRYRGDRSPFRHF